MQWAQLLGISNVPTTLNTVEEEVRVTFQNRKLKINPSFDICNSNIPQSVLHLSKKYTENINHLQCNVSVLTSSWHVLLFSYSDIHILALKPPYILPKSNKNIIAYSFIFWFLQV